MDPNRVLATSEEEDAERIPGTQVVAWTRSWVQEEFELIEPQVNNEDHVFFRRRHVDNLRVKKTGRRYAAAARRAAVSKLGGCLIVASYKGNPKVALLPGQSADWQAYHVPEAPSRSSTHPDRLAPSCENARCGGSASASWASPAARKGPARSVSRQVPSRPPPSATSGPSGHPSPYSTNLEEKGAGTFYSEDSAK